MNYSIDITVATKRDLADAFDYIDGMLMNPSAADRLIDNAWKQFRSLDIFPQRFPIVTDPMLAGWKIRFLATAHNGIRHFIGRIRIFCPDFYGHALCFIIAVVVSVFYRKIFEFQTVFAVISILVLDCRF